MIEYGAIVAGRALDRRDAALRCERLGETTLAAVVADGVSCGPGAGAAARYAVGAATPLLRAMPQNKRRKRKAWERLFRMVDRVVARREGAGLCAMAALIADDGVVRGASVGHGAVWIVSPSVRDDVSTKQSSEPLIGTGRVAATFFDATLPGPTSEDERGKRGGGALLVMSSGLWRQVDEKHIVDAAIKHNPQDAAARLEEVARWRFNGALAEDIAGVVARR